MFEDLTLAACAVESRTEAWLRALLDDVVVELAPEYAPHRATPAVDDRVPGAAALEQVLDEGGAHLRRAVLAHHDLARAAAEQAQALAAFARCRPSSLDRPDAEVGAAAARTRAARPAALTEVSEWAVDEVAVALQLTSSAAADLLVDSVLLVERLPATWAALHAGRLSWRHAQVLTDLVAPLSDEVRPVAEERLLARAGGKTSSQLRVAARRVVQRLDAEALARRVVAAIRERRVVVHPGEDGMATLSAVLPAPVARAVEEALRQCAEAAATPGDERTQAQRMVDCLVDLVLRPGEHGLPPVQVQLTLVAAVETLLGSDEPGEVAGDLVPAEVVRQLARSLGLLPGSPADTSPDAGPPDAAPSGSAPPDTAPSDTAPPDSPPSDSPPSDRAPAGGAGRGAVAGLLSAGRVRGTALAHRPELALTDELTGQLAALTGAAGLRSRGALGPPPESAGYRPDARLDRFVRLRDRRCRFPGCRARPARSDLDHTVPWPAGPTAEANLACLCRHHHRLRHQAPGWRLHATSDGGLTWTTPGGITATTRPPRFGSDDDLPAAVSTSASTPTPPDDLPPF